MPGPPATKPFPPQNTSRSMIHTPVSRPLFRTTNRNHAQQLSKPRSASLPLHKPRSRSVRRSPRPVLFLYLFIFLCSGQALSSVVALSARLLCSTIPGLTPDQRALCESRSAAVAAAEKGAALGLDECAYQFADMRWNCSLPSALPPEALLHGAAHLHHNKLLNRFTAYGSREAAYVSAITAAGAAYAVTQYCSQGLLPDCGCDKSKMDGQFSPQGFKWAGCSVDWQYGLHFSERYLDAGEIEENSLTLMNLHNNNVGRKVVKNKLELTCKCLGTSGSCTIKTCWTSLSPFREIGSQLRVRYLRAKHVMAIHGNRALKPQYLRLHHQPRMRAGTEVARAPGKPRRRDLVFLETSPTYCDFDPALGSLGTRGRLCNATSRGSDNCDIMCCGRGYETFESVRTERCRCHFHWCCYVTCEECVERVTTHTCK